MVERSARRRLEAALDADVSIGRCSGTLIGGVQFEKVRIRPRPGSPLAEAIQVQRIRLDYSLLRVLLGGDRPVGKVMLEGARFTLRPAESGPTRPLAESFTWLVGILKTAHRWPSIEIRDVGLRCGDFQATGVSGHLLLTGSAVAGTANLDLKAGKLSMGQLDLGRLNGRATVIWPRKDCDARLDADIQLKGLLAEAAIKVSVPLGASDPKAPCELSLAAAMHDSQALARHFAPLDRFAGRLWKRADLNFSASGPAGNMQGRGKLKLAATSGPEVRPPKATEAADELDILYGAGVLQVLPATLRTVWGPVHVGGRFPVRLDMRPLPRILPKDDAVDLHARLDVENVATILPYLPATVRGMKPAGRLSITGRLGGTLLAPSPSVEFRLSDVSLRPADPLAPVEGLRAVAVLTPGQVELQSLVANMGHGQIAATARVSFAGKGRVQAEVSARNALLASSRDSTVRIRIDADLKVSGDLEGAELSGEARIPMLQYYREFVGGGEAAGEVKAVADQDEVIGALVLKLPHAAGGGIRLSGLEAADRIALNVRVRSGGEVRVENSTIGVLLGGDLRLKGTAADPALSGEIRALSGEVRLFPGTFLPIRKMTVNLPRKPGAESYVNFESLLHAGRAKVFVGVSGPLAAPQLQLSSDPPYPRDHLLALLAYGRPPGAAGAGGQSQALLGQAARIVGGLLTDRMPRAEPKSSLLSRFVIDMEAGGRRGREGSVWQRPEHGTNMFVEYIVNDYLSVVTERDNEGRINADLQLRFRWPRSGRRQGESRKNVSLNKNKVKPARKEARSLLLRGNRAFSVGRLLAVLAPDIERLGSGDWSPAAISDVEFRLRHFYLESGYCFVKTKCGLNQGVAEIGIEEGPLVRLGAIDFGGNSALSNSALRKALFSDRPRLGAAPFSQRVLKAQAESLLAHYREEGYLRAEVLQSSTGYDSRNRRMNVTHVVREGLRFRLKQVAWKGVGDGERAVLAEMSRAYIGRELRASVTGNLVFAARDRFREQGRPAARAIARLKLDEVRGLGEITVEVSPGPRVRLRKIDVAGNRRVRSKFIKRASRLHAGTLITQSGVRSAERRLADTGLFRDIRSVPLKVDAEPGEAPGSADREQLSDLRLEVEELEPCELKLRGGYGSFDRIRVGAEVGTRNAFGNGESFSLAASGSTRGYRLDADARLFPSPGLPMRAGVHAFYEVRDDLSYDLKDLGISPSVSYMLTRRDELAAGLLLEWIDTDDVSLGVPAGDQQDFHGPGRGIVAQPGTRAITDVAGVQIRPACVDVAGVEEQHSVKVSPDPDAQFGLPCQIRFSARRVALDLGPQFPFVEAAYRCGPAGEEAQRDGDAPGVGERRDHPRLERGRHRDPSAQG